MRTAIFLLILLILPAGLSSQPVAREASRIDFVSRQMGVPIRGGFGRFDADIRFDPARREHSRAKITVYLDSVDAGSEDATVEIKRKPWLDVKNHPRAEFISGSLRALGPDQYRVEGKMTIKGRTRDASAVFSEKREKGARVFEGKFIISRLDFGIGTGEWSDTDTVADEVEVFFRFYVPASNNKK